MLEALFSRKSHINFKNIKTNKVKKKLLNNYSPDLQITLELCIK